MSDPMLFRTYFAIGQPSLSRYHSALRDLDGSRPAPRLTNAPVVRIAGGAVTVDGLRVEIGRDAHGEVVRLCIPNVGSVVRTPRDVGVSPVLDGRTRTQKARRALYALGRAWWGLTRTKGRKTR